MHPNFRSLATFFRQKILDGLYLFPVNFEGTFIGGKIVLSHAEYTHSRRRAFETAVSAINDYY